MDFPVSPPYGFLAAKLVEDLELLERKLEESGTPSPAETISMFETVIESFFAVGELLEGISKSEFVVNGNYAFGPFEELMEISLKVLTHVERTLPVFLDETTVFDEPIREKVRQLKRSFETLNGTGRTEGVDFEELAFVVKEVARTFDVLNFRIKTLLERIS